jgi:hypothetical protein
MCRFANDCTGSRESASHVSIRDKTDPGTVLSGIEVPRRKVRQPPRRGGTPPHAVRSPLRRGIRQLGDAPPEREILIRHWHEGDEHVIGRDPGRLLQQTGYRGQQGFLVR